MWASSVLVEGRSFDEKIRLFGHDLVLNGTGVRAVAWFKGYAAGLYLGKRTQQANSALAMAGPKRLRLQMLQDVPAVEFTKAFQKGVARNTPAAQLPALRERMAQFEGQIAAVGQVRKDDIVDLDLEPARGLAFTVNGTLRGPHIAGADLYAALLRTFLGARPYDENLKAGLLGRTA
ncbi:MAG TPA: chalcone isomerase family protein [Rubrivivax sp.]